MEKLEAKSARQRFRGSISLTLCAFISFFGSEPCIRLFIQVFLSLLYCYFDKGWRLLSLRIHVDSQKANKYEIDLTDFMICGPCIKVTLLFQKSQCLWSLDGHRLMMLSFNDCRVGKSPKVGFKFFLGRHAWHIQFLSKRVLC